MSTPDRNSGWLSSWWNTESSEEIEETTPTSSFAPVTPKSVIDNAIIKKCWLDIKFEGGSQSTVMKSQIALVHNPSCSKQQLDIQIKSMAPEYKVIQTPENYPIVQGQYLQHKNLSVDMDIDQNRLNG